MAEFDWLNGVADQLRVARKCEDAERVLREAWHESLRRLPGVEFRNITILNVGEPA